MVNTLSWIFSGIGTTLIGALIGGAIGYRIGVKKVTKQTQKAGDGVIQIQVGSDNQYGENHK